MKKGIHKKRRRTDKWGDSDADGEVLWALSDNLGSVRDLGR